MNGRPLIIGHRGASAWAPENTLAAFQNAIDIGADGLEFDVRLSRDGIPVVFHDEDLERIAGRPDRIDQLTAAELVEIDAGSWFNRAFPARARPEFAGERISTLAGTLDFLGGFAGRIYIELKCTPADGEQLSRAVCSLISRSPLLPQMVVKSFTLAAIPLVRRFCPPVRTAALFEPTLKTVLRKQGHIIDAALAHGAHELSLHHTLATRRLCRLAARQNMPVTIWTVDRKKWLTKASYHDIHAFITNDPSEF